MALQSSIRTKPGFGLGFHLLHMLYQVLWPVFILYALLKFWRKGKNEPAYRQHIGERFGFYRTSTKPDNTHRPVWIHALSLGETRGVAPLVHHLLAMGHHIILTHTTPAGRAAGAQLFANAQHNGQLTQIYIPFDFTPCVRRFFHHFKPQTGILMEADLWPGLIAEANQKDVPLFVVNARYPDNKVARDKKTFNIKPRLFHGLTHIFAKTDKDVDNFKRQRFDRTSVAGELKFDIKLDAIQIDKAHAVKSAHPAPFTLVAASTRAGEEEIVLDAIETLNTRNITARLVIVPRSPQRFDDVAHLIEARGFAIQRRSTLPKKLQDIDTATIAPKKVLLGDSLGEMAFYLGLGDAIFVGGSMFDIGGHSVTEPLALHQPILMGPSQWGTGEAAELAAQHSALITVHDSAEFADKLTQLIQDDATRQTMQQGAASLMQQMGGATQRIYDAIAPFITKSQ